MGKLTFKGYQFGGVRGHLQGLPCIRPGGGSCEVWSARWHTRSTSSRSARGPHRPAPVHGGVRGQPQVCIVHATTTLGKFDPFDWRARASEQQPRHPRRRSRRGARLDGREWAQPQPPQQGPRPQRGLPALGLRDDKEQVGEDELERRPRRIRRRRGRRPRRRRRTRRPSEEFSEKHPDLLRDGVAAAGRRRTLSPRIGSKPRWSTW